MELQIEQNQLLNSSTTILIINMYEAMFAAMLAIEVINPPIKDIEGINNFPYKLTLSNGSSVLNLFLDLLISLVELLPVVLFLHTSFKCPILFHL